MRVVVRSAGRRTGAIAEGVTGQAAGAADVSAVSGADVVHIVPVVLVLLAILLALGLGSLVAPIYMVATVALSFLASMGLSVLIFVIAAGEPGVNFSLPFFLFIFIMALGEDYNILVMRRIREESVERPPTVAVREAISATGSTVTAAGLVLSSTFAVLAVATSGQVRQIGTGLSLGVLLDSFVVRTLMVPSVAVVLGRANWWPGKLWRTQPRSLSPKEDDASVLPGYGVPTSPDQMLGSRPAGMRPYDRALRAIKWSLAATLVALCVVTAVGLSSKNTRVLDATTRGVAPLVASNRTTFPTAVGNVVTGTCPSSRWCFGVGMTGSGQFVTVAGNPRMTLTAGSWPPKARSIGRDNIYAYTTPSISCPSAAECVAASGPLVSRTTDQGKTWTRSDVPGLRARITSVSCPSPSLCIAGGTINPYLWTTASVAAVWSSTDGAASWNLVQAPRGLGWIQELSCSLQLCVALAAPSTMPQTSATQTVNGSSLEAIVSLDSGRNWRADNSFPALYPNATVTCPNGAGPTTCWAEGMLVGSHFPAQDSIFSSSNNAETWHQSATVRIGASTELGCPQPGVCVAGDGVQAIMTTDYGHRWRKIASPGGLRPMLALSCASRGCFASGFNAVYNSPEVAVSLDSGVSWQVGTIATGVAGVGEIACGRGQRCLTTANLDRSVELLDSLDGGKSWTRGVQLPGTSTFAPSVACSSSNWCAAFAIASAGTSDSTPLAVLADTSGVTFGTRWRIHRTTLTSTQVGSFSALACPRPRVCVVALDDGGVAITYNAGRSWDFIRARSRQGLFLPDISCHTISSCDVAFTSQGSSSQSYVLELQNNMSASRLNTLPFNVREISSFACARNGSCWMLASAPNASSTSGATPNGVQLLKLFKRPSGSDAWVSVPLPVGYSIQNSFGIWCSNGPTCWMVVVTPHGVRELITADNGATWTSRAVDVNENEIGWITCKSPSTCVATNSYVDTAHPAIFTLRPGGAR